MKRIQINLILTIACIQLSAESQPTPVSITELYKPTPNIHNHLFYMKIYNAFTAEYNPYPIFTHLSCLVTCV
uniref:ORF 14 n=1 Tax=Human herpesvirus 3 TaxID=10335 RepID=A0A097I147_HHV3|nr:ORF 14 [Human alphaherpesvirus 3]AIT54483.1 ORF 14 [Human alphaherpesvirus 3]AIT54556.1 ORF 14 [Human alphaherpesvirus 3]